jgi:hypothetical protein
LRRHVDLCFPGCTFRDSRVLKTKDDDGPYTDLADFSEEFHRLAAALAVQ